MPKSPQSTSREPRSTDSAAVNPQAPAGDAQPPVGDAQPPARDGARSLLPGIAVAVLAAAISLGIAALATRAGIGFLSPLIVALILGAIVGSTVVLPTVLKPGTAWTARHVLRAGIVLLGLDLSIGQLLGIGWQGAVIIIATVTITYLGTLAVGRALRVPERTRLYVATGFSICGAAAIAAMEGAISRFDEEDARADRAKLAREARAADSDLPDDVREAQAQLRADAREATNANALGTALALVTLYGALMIVLLPWLSGLLGLDDNAAGVWIGASTHEVAHVVAAAGLVSTVALAAATITKLARVVLLAPLVAVVSVVTSRKRRAEGAVVAASIGRGSAPLVPVFVLGFLAAVLIRSTGMLPAGLLDVMSLTSKGFLTAAMFALGTTINIPVLIRTGKRPLVLGAISTAIAVGVSLLGVLILA